MNTPDLSRFAWRKSSYSSDNGGACVEIGLPPEAWRKSSYSEDNGGDCVEVAALADAAAIRDSKNPDGGALMLSGAVWNAFRTAIRA
ncbi:uncharacterized protein DUF397 [Herbihabitans rhizosphaerae]|uniref:Uncharacterized protein DUF397 n=1 Tax=Herbihabitans rhizosphaerae TaxID=1872711 RepID=A0A4V2EU20_9PSEU|nr:DUF397 domain-containing protein [Herbihabitans rhizosphaerae]RZS43043.1 uncharacterized protein DUF397 [Herbihabitans rhizosphaerae]